MTLHVIAFVRLRLEGDPPARRAQIPARPDRVVAHLPAAALEKPARVVERDAPHEPDPDVAWPRHARSDEHGVPIPLPEQDRSRWDRATIAEASAILRAALARGDPGPFQLEATISAVHCDARTADDTDWSQIAELWRQGCPTP